MVKPIRNQPTTTTLFAWFAATINATFGVTTGQTQGQTQGQAPGLAIGKTPGQAPGQMLGQTLGQLSGRAQGQMLGCIPGQLRGQTPADILRCLGAPAALVEMFLPLCDCEIIHKQVADGLVPDLECRDQKRKRSTGQFYTPEALADRLAGMADLACKAGSPDFAGQSGRVLDPACGDGSFLMAIARRMAATSKGAGSSLSPVAERSRSDQSGQSSLTSALRQAQGPGSSASPVAPVPPVAERSRSDQSGQSHLTSALRQAQGPGSGFLSQLFGFDIDLPALLICLTRLICAFPGQGWPVLAHRDFLLQPPEAEFDLVIGNPPYRVNLEESFKERLAGLYQTGEGEKDLYTFFLEAGLKALVPGGQLIMLTSHTWLVNHQCRKIRNHLFAEHCVQALMLLPARFFVQAPGVLPVVTFARKAIQSATFCSPDYLVKVASDYSEERGWQREYSCPADVFPGGNGLRQAIVPETLRAAFAKMQVGSRKLGDASKIGVGIQESMQRGGKVSRFVSDRKLSDRHRPVLRGRELAPFKINYEGNYLDYGPHLVYAGNEKLFSGPKLLYQNIRNEKLKMRLVVAYDGGGYFPKNSLSYIVSESADYPLLFLAGLLNSLPVNAWFSSQFHSFHITVTQMRQVPLPPFNADLFAAVAECAGQLSAEPVGSSAYSACFSRLNRLVCSCYDLPDDPTGLLQAFDNFLEQAAGL